MKTRIYIGLMVLIISSLSACSSYDYYTAGLNTTHLSRYHTFAWMPVISNNGKKMNPANGAADAKIKETATQVLTEKGLTLQQRQPDLLISYTATVGRGTRTNYYTTYGGWGGWGWGGWYNPYYAFGPGFAYRGALTYEDQEHYKEGTLVIDLIDRRTQKVIWRGFGVGEVHHDPQKNIDDLPKVVQGILEQMNTATPPVHTRTMSS